MRSKTKKKIFIGIGTLIVIVLLLIAAIFIFRDNLLQKAVAKAIEKAKTDYQSELSIKSAQFDGLSGIKVEEVILVPANGDTLVHLQEFNTHVNIWKLFTGDIQLGQMQMSNGFIQLKKDEKGKNFQAFLSSAKKDSTQTSGEKTNYAKTFYRLLNQTLNLVPADLHLKNLELRVLDMNRKVILDLSQLTLVDKKLASDILVTTNTFSQHWNISGMADPREKMADLRFFSRDTSGIKLPYIDEKWNVKSGFDSIRLKVDRIDMSGNELLVEGFSSITNLKVLHPKIASREVVIKNAGLDYKFRFGGDFIAIDSSSIATLNKIKVRPFLEYSVENDPTYTFKLNIPKMSAQDFIVSLPEGLFTNFEGMEADGNFDFHLDFKYNKNKPNQTIFDTKLQKEGLKIKKYGAADLAKLNGSFVYRAIENGHRQRAVLVSPDNIYYTKLEDISPFLRKSVLTTEDPSFFSHKGFINDAFKQSIIQNIRTKKFARGASTISMQLVKNVFLTREKTLSRKLEEILLVYIMENNHIVSKSRMLEVYFNIIEWGPNVYGIGEASLFYFMKHPSELTLDECLYLASIVPRPKKFMWQFSDQATLKPHVIRHSDYLKNLMMRRGLITEEDTIGQKKNIELYGSARNYIKKKEIEAIEIDSLAIDEFDF